jgi:serine/threonine-protein kinase
MANLIGQSLGRYHILEQLGEGGMATVYKAYDTRLETEVALKFIRTEKLTLETMSRSLKRFEREAKALAQLTHPNIVPVMDYGEYDGKPYLVMPYLRGGTLKQRLGKPLTYREAADLLAPIAHALDYAHQHNILHRDVKPSNILLTDTGQPMLSDFGIAKILEDEQTIDLTGTGVGVGTPEYMAPEQGLVHEIDHRADIYSLGTVFYECVTGRKPYQADTPLAIMLKRASEPLPRPSQFVRGLPDSVEYVLLKALAKNPADRYPTAGAFAAALENLSRDSQPRIRQTGISAAGQKWPWIAVAAVAVCVSVLGLGWLFRSFVVDRPVGVAPSSTSMQDFSTSSVVYLAASNTPEPTQITPESTATVALPSPTAEPESSADLGSDGMRLIYVPEGEFTMGSNGGETDERPAHSVHLSAYWIDETEVTNAMFAEFLNQMGNQFEGNATWIMAPDSNDTLQFYGGAWRSVAGYEDYPIVKVTWYGANAYCAWAGRRLPTEAEWEKAARGTDGNTLPWGGSLDCLHANYGGCTGGAKSVGSYPQGASPYGVLDMFGNVWEWVYDKYGTDFYRQSPLADPVGPASGKHHILRGAAWDTADAKRLRLTFRYNRDPNLTGSTYGFRCARTP